MPRKSKGTRLWLEPAERRNGKIIRAASWVIRDGSRKVRTGCAQGERGEAERFLQAYLADKYETPRGKDRHPSQILVADVLNIYLTDKAPHHANPQITKGRVLTLADFWGERTLSDVNGTSCREYVAWRLLQPRRAARPDVTGKPARMVTEGGARRELEDLRSAINHHRSEGLCSEIVAVKLPAKGESRQEWLTRSEAARLIQAAWRAKGPVPNAPDRATGKHIARFILVGLYTGTRHAAICSAAFTPAIGRGHVDLDAGVFHRRAAGARETKKRQPPVRIPDRLLAHLRRWQRLGIARHAVVEWNGKPVQSVKRGFAAAVKSAGLGKAATPHILRHTAATWAMQRGIPIQEASDFLGMSAETLSKVYYHAHPDFMKRAADAIGRKG